METMVTAQSMKIFKSGLDEKTKEFMFFVLAQLASMDSTNEEKLQANASKDVAEKLKEWHSNDKIYYEMTIRNGQRHGSFSMWDTAGKLICTMPFEDGKITGTVHLYKQAGEKEIQFKDDCPILLDK